MSKPIMVIMAAGMGSRFGGLKQIEPMGPNGETLIDYAVYDALRAGFGKVVFVIRESFHAAFQSQVSSRFKSVIDIDYAYQELSDLPEGFSVPVGRGKPWGTAHALRACRHVVDAPFSVQNADDYYGVAAYDVMAQALRAMPNTGSVVDGCMVGFDTMNTLSPNGLVSRGICRMDHGWLVGVDERTKVGLNANGQLHYMEEDHSCLMRGDEICSLNFWGFSNTILSMMESLFISFLEKNGDDSRSEWQLPVIIDRLINADSLRVKLLHSADRWYGVTYPEDRDRVVEALCLMHDAGVYPKNLWN